MTKRQLVRKTSNVNEAVLERLVQTEPRRHDAPSVLALSDISVANAAFQWRLADEDVLADTRFVEELVDALDAQDAPLKPFEPLLVAPVGKQFFLVDGHHRLDAYLTFGWEGPVPVEIFSGDLQEAILEAWKRNAHNKLPMTTASRFEAAWKLVKTDKFTKRQITGLTNVRRSTLTTMRGVLAEFGKRASVRPWSEARRLRRNLDGPIDDGWKQKVAREIALHLAKGPKQTTDPELLAMALTMAKEELPAQLTAEWLSEVVEDVLLAAATDEGCPDEVQQDIGRVFRALFRGPAMGVGEALEADQTASEGTAEGAPEGLAKP